ncbi:hypothetical protein M9435_005931 [Picochlorum sp. BPE23]|nr:hypothetical protein M9435_005931 [Picochlorum sp. BPE23]
MSGGQFRGTSAEQDSRFSNKEERQLKSLNKEFPLEVRKKVDLSKVQWESIKPWIAKRTTELLGGLEDDILINFIIDMVEDKKTLDPRRIYISLTGFLEQNTGVFVKELWNLLIDASSSETGVPRAFVQEVKQEPPEDGGYRERDMEYRGRRRDDDYDDGRSRRRRRDSQSRSYDRYDDYRSGRRYRESYDDDEYRYRRYSRRRSRSGSRRRRRRRSPSVEAKMKQAGIKTEHVKKEEEL